MRTTNRDPLERNMGYERRDILPVPAPGQKLKTTDGQGKQKFFVKCVSSVPLAYDTSKEEVRMNHIHAVIQRKINDPKFNHLIGLPRLATGPNPSQSKGMAPTQVNPNPFMKSQAPIPLPAQTFPLALNPPTMGNNNTQFARQNNNPLVLPNNNPFSKNQNQFQNNNSFNQPRNLNGMSAFTAPGLVKQTSFGTGLGGGFGTVSTATSAFGNVQPQASTGFQQAGQPGQGMFGQQNMAGGNTMGTGSLTPSFGSNQPQVPIQLITSPSFGNVNPSFKPKQGTFAGNPLGQSQPQTSIFSSQPQTQILTSQTTPIQLGTLPQSTPPTFSPLDQNIKQLLESKPNLWNILALDPEYKNGFNECGRMYVKSVLQRIIDENILSQDSLNKIIVEIYKQMYGADNFQKMLESKRKQFKQDQKVKDWRIDSLMAFNSNQIDKKNEESVFPKDFDQIGEDFYRSFKRRSAKFFDDSFTSTKTEADEYESRLERKYYQIKRPVKNLQLKVKFIEVKRPQESGKVIENPYTAEGLDKIVETIQEIRTQHRKQIMPTEEELPKIDGFTIVPSIQDIKLFTKYELQSVPKVTISNEWGSIRFKAPISLLNKNLAECLIISQKTVEIMDEEWKVRDAEITFKKFADFNALDEVEQDALEEKIVAWCEREKLQLVKIDRERGQVVIQI